MTIQELMIAAEREYSLEKISSLFSKTTSQHNKKMTTPDSVIYEAANGNPSAKFSYQEYMAAHRRERK